MSRVPLVSFGHRFYSGLLPYQSLQPWSMTVHDLGPNAWNPGIVIGSSRLQPDERHGERTTGRNQEFETSLQSLKLGRMVLRFVVLS